MLLNLFSRILLEIGRETQNMTEGRENSNFSSDSESDDESNFENDENTITNQPVRNYANLASSCTKKLNKISLLGGNISMERRI